MNSLQTLKVYGLKGKDIRQMPGTQTEPGQKTQGSCPIKPVLGGRTCIEWKESEDMGGSRF